MKKRITILIVIVTVSIACSQNNNKERDKAFNAPSLRQDSVIVDSKLDELVQTVLNLPSVIKLSKSEFIQKKYDRIFIFFDEGVLKPNDSIFYQNSFALKVKQVRETDAPCYVFKQINIQGDTAYVLLNFDVTGFTSYGNLSYVNGKWVPHKDFKVGFR